MLGPSLGKRSYRDAIVVEAWHENADREESVNRFVGARIILKHSTDNRVISRGVAITVDVYKVSRKFIN